ncbi:MAG TPA: DUF5668 domain-containing protein [Candidatus Saccharimonadales bacterium]|nr:DUF5668 domain-containing protein [Candidatus Saccharimonadales bacterium]
MGGGITTDTQEEPTTTEVHDYHYYHHRHHHSFVWAFILIALGMIFLFNNFGLLPWGVWDTLWRLWPVLLIIWGLQTIFGRSWWGQLIVAILTLALLAAVIAFIMSTYNVTLDTWIFTHLGFRPSDLSVWQCVR